MIADSVRPRILQNSSTGNTLVVPRGALVDQFTILARFYAHTRGRSNRQVVYTKPVPCLGIFNGGMDVVNTNRE